MGLTAARTGARLAAAAVAVALLASACSSDSGSDASSSAAASETPEASVDASSSASGTAEPAGAAAQACAAYFELDLLNSTYVGGAVADGDMTEVQVRTDFRRFLRAMVAKGTIAESEGDLDARFVANATRMKNTVKRLPAGQALSDLSRKQQRSFAVQSSRVEKSCARAGFPLPDDNVTARTAASI